MAITKLNSLAIPDDTIVEADLSYPLTSFSSTGIDDNATSTKLTVSDAGIDVTGTADVDGTVNSRGLQAKGSPSLSFNASNWMTQQETGVARTYICGPDASTYQPWEIYRATSTGGASLTMKLDASGNVSTTERLRIGTGSSDTRITLNNEGTEQTNSSNYIRGVSGQLIYNSASSVHKWEIAGSEKMRIDSSGNVSVDRGQKIQWHDGTIGSGNVNAAIEGTGDPALKLYTRQGGTSTLTERMRIDSNGNVGIGLTPSAWSTGKAVELGFQGNALWGNAADEVIVSQNAYYNSGWKYATNRVATHYSQYNGAHRWFTAPSGTANGALTWSESMRIDASGKVGIGVSPTGSLHTTVKDSSGSDVFVVAQNTTSNRIAGFKVLDESGTASLVMQYDNGGNAASISNPNNGSLGIYLGGTAAANHLDDYEEGTWTVNLNSSGGDATISVVNTTAYYVKIGRKVTLFWYSGAITCSASGSGYARIQGLPFTAANLYQNYAVGSHAHTTVASSTDGYAVPNGTTYVLMLPSSTYGAPLIASASPLYMMLTVTYYTA